MQAALQRALEAGRGVVFAPTRTRAAEVLTGFVGPRENPYASLTDPFTPLTLGHLTRCLANAGPAHSLVDASWAPPWDDALWRAAVRKAPDFVLVAPARFHRWLSGAAPELEVLVDPWSQALLHRAETENDGPVLAELLEASHADERVARLLRLAEHEVAYGTSKRANEWLLEARTLARDAARSEHPERLHDLAAVLDALGDNVASYDDLDTAGAAYAESARVSARLLELKPEASSRWGVGVSELRVGGLAQAQGRYRDARARLEVAYEHASTPDRRTQILGRLADTVALMGDLEAAETLVREGILGLRAQLARTPRRFDLRADLLALLIRLTGLQLGRGRQPEAMRTRRELPVLVGELLGRDGRRHRFVELAAAAVVTWADSALLDGAMANALKALEHADALFAELIGMDQDRARPIAERARALRRQTYCGRRWTGATALAIVRTLQHRHPRDPGRQHDLALGFMALAWQAELEDDRATAQTCWQAALDAAPDGLPAFRRTRARCADALARLVAPVRDFD